MNVDKVKILVVDDMLPNRVFLQDEIIILGHDCLLAEDGMSALEKIKENSPDLVLLDIMMPKMDGYQVLQHMKDNEDFKHIPVIVISASS